MLSRREMVRQDGAAAEEQPPTRRPRRARRLPLLELPYDERRCIVVVDARTARTAHAALRHGTNAPSADGAATPARSRLRQWVKWGLVGARVADLSGRSGDEQADPVRGIVELGSALLPVTLAEIEGVAFPPGHPKRGAVYGGNPVVPSLYYPFATFHRQTFEHKFSEALHLLVSLGATRMTVCSEQGWSKKFAAELRIPNFAGFGFHRHHLRRSKALFEGEFAPHPPRLPDDLAWYPHEPAWQEIASQRIEGRAKRVSLLLEYTDDYAIGAHLAERLSERGFEIGGRFSEHVDTIWRFDVVFRRSMRERLGAMAAGEHAAPHDDGAA